MDHMAYVNRPGFHTGFRFIVKLEEFTSFAEGLNQEYEKIILIS